VKRLALLVASTALALASIVGFNPTPAEAINTAPAWAICTYINPDTDYWRLIRSTDFNLFGDFGVGCTYDWRPANDLLRLCKIYDRNTGQTWTYSGYPCTTPP